MEAAVAIDKSQVPPLHQKRIVAFINHFLVSSSTFLSEFSQKCESKFIEVERKMQKIEAALTIIEAKLASIPDVQENVAPATTAPLAVSENGNGNLETTTLTAEPSAAAVEESVIVETVVVEPSGVRAADDERYRKFFKMLQFGVPAGAVKIKMQTEGADPNILDTPNLILADGVAT